MKILEIGNYLAPAYAGMILSEQGHYVEKWHIGNDPILSLNHGDQLWEWVNHGKTVINKDIQSIGNLINGDFDGIIDNFLPSTLQKWGINPIEISNRLNLRWVSLRSEDEQRGFDIIAQSRSWMEYADWIPFYVGDTTAGLWLAFKLLSGQEKGHFVIGQASCLQKLVEGELTLNIPRNKQIPWDNELYGFNRDKQQSEVIYKGQLLVEPVRGFSWKWRNLWHNNGRIKI